MANVNIPYAQPGLASFELTDDYLNTTLLNGSHPALSPAVSGVAGADIERFEVVGFNAAGEIVPAVWNATPANAIKPIGVCYVAALDGQRVLYWYAGHFNLDMLIFDASFDTDAKKESAFVGAPTPTQIRADKRFG